MTMKIMPITDLRRQATQLVKLVKEGGDVVYITQHGRPAAVLIDYEQYESLLTQLEELADQAAFAAAADEPERDYEIFLAEMGASPDESPDVTE
jgi:prevent-host-death family protein